MDLWVAHQFKVLPTDPRFLDLTDEQKTLLFWSYMELPDSERMREAHQKKKQEAIPSNLKSDLETVCGYTKEQIAYFEDQLEKAYG